jgi:quercetin dioxygenase-like cupin family protein
MSGGLKVTRLADAVPYDAPNHFDVAAVRLQGFQPDGPQNFWVGLSRVAPGGRAGPDASPLEKVYVILAGELTIITDSETVTLGPRDSCTIGGNVRREMINRANSEVEMIVVMPYPAAQP